MRSWQILILERLARRFGIFAPVLRVTPLARVAMLPWLLRVIEVTARGAIVLFGLLALLAAIKSILWLTVFLGLLALLAFGIFRVSRWIRRFVQLQTVRVANYTNEFLARQGAPDAWQINAGNEQQPFQARRFVRR